MSLPRIAHGLCLALALASGAVQAKERVTHEIAPDNTGWWKESWTIDEPEVRARSKEYTEVKLSPGDTVWVKAEGCVDTGGIGRTWKRYVDPRGPNSDRLYHGLLQIPGATQPEGELVAVAGVLERPLKVSSALPAPVFLRLGYQDDNYDDNAYGKHDDGTGKQCRGIGPARVSVAVCRDGERCRGGPPFDLVASEVDDAGLPRNPRWQYQLHEGKLPDPDVLCFSLPRNFSDPRCTSEPVSYDVAVLPNVLICALGAKHPILGHVNWWAATYEGTVRWIDQSIDGDYNFSLTPHDQAGLVPNNRGAFHVEFDADETTDHFQTPWWSAFRTEVESLHGRPADMVRDREAVFTGLVGLDCEHECYTELHPVYVMALHAADDPEKDVWTFFARNWGNEGFCSHRNHILDATTLAVRLPWRPGATRVEVLNQPGDGLILANVPDVPEPRVTWKAQEGVVVEFSLPRASSDGPRPRIHGQFHLRWTIPAPAPEPRAMPKETAAQARQEEGDAEDFVARLLPPERKAAMAKKAPPDLDSHKPVPVTAKRVEEVSLLPRKKAVRPEERVVEDDRKLERDRERMRQLCETAGDRIPGICTALQPGR
jgi:hypothetical protein